MDIGSTSYGVLIVDDDPAICMTMKYALERSDLVIYQSDNGADALVGFNEIRPDLVLLDVSMPGMDGFECCRRLRQLPYASQCAVVMVTGLDNPKDIEKAFEAGATDFITKPINWSLFAHRVHYILKSNAARISLTRNQSKLCQAHTIAQIGYWEWDFKAPQAEFSLELGKLLGRGGVLDSASWRSMLSFVHRADRRLLLGSLRDAIEHNRGYDIEYRVIRADGEIRDFHDRTEVVFEGGVRRIIGTLLDVTHLKNTEREIAYYAYYDTLTKLPNRRLFLERFEEALAAAQRREGQVCLLFIDLDHFKNINDSFGHHVGDEVLCEAAARIKHSVRAYDVVAAKPDSTQNTVARLAGDEFTVLLCEINDIENVASIAQRIIDAFSLPLDLNQATLYISVSIGIAIYPDDSQSAQALLQNADIAMYHAKEMGRNNYQFFSEKLNGYLKQRFEVEFDLRLALERNEFVLFYQPQFQADREGVVGFEALLRWQHPERGLLTPDQFIEVAESSGLIIPIGAWVLDTACRQAATWCQDGKQPYGVAVNLSALQFNNKDLPQQVKSALSASGLESALLELEITESAIIHNIAETLNLMTTLKELGVKLAIDDFGTGYSSLSYLKNFPIDTLKVDKSFIDGIVSSRKDAAIAQTILQLANNLGMLSIAEGVETQEQVRNLLAMGCRQFQGYYYSRPLSADDASALLCEFNVNCRESR